MVVALVVRRVGDQLKVEPAVQDIVVHAEEVALLEEGVAGGTAEAVGVKEAVAGLHD